MLNIKGKSYTYCNWAICAYYFIQNSSSYVDTILPNEPLIIKIMNDAKKLRKYDFLKNAALHYSNIFKNKMRNLNKISYIPTISYKYILEFANSDSMQCDLDIIEYIINEIKKINGDHANADTIADANADTIADTGADANTDTNAILTYIISTNVITIDVGNAKMLAPTEMASYINAVEQKQYELIQLFLIY
jgi:hypothetical protein